jgi:hypothetical protein
MKIAKIIIVIIILLFIALLLTKEKSNYQTEGYFIIANGEKYIELSTALIKSIRKVGDTREITVFSNDTEACNRILSDFKPIKFIPYDENEYPNLSKWERLGGIPKMLMPIVTPYDKTIFLDADSFMLNDMNDIWADEKYWKYGISTSGSDKADSSWHFNFIDTVSEKVGLGPLPRAFSTLIFINKKLIPTTFKDDIFHYFNEYPKYGIKREFTGDSVPDEILYSIIMAKYGFRPTDTDTILTISNNASDSLDQMKASGYKIVTIFHKDPSVFKNIIN